MRIDSITIENYKSFLQSPEILFAPGFNLIVGKNNAGKSSLLKAIALTFTGQPYISEQVPPETSGASLSRVKIKLAVSGSELRDLLVKQRFAQKFVWPKGVGISSDFYLRAIEYILAQPELYTVAKKRAAKNSGAEWETPTPPPSGYETVDSNPQDGNIISFMVQSDQGVGKFQLSSGPSADNPAVDFGGAIPQTLASRIYVFDAQRRSLSSHPLTWSDLLNPDAGNLVDVLHTIHSRNQSLFRQYLTLLKQIFPDVYGISFDQSRQGGGQVEMRLWLAPPSPRSSDLTISLGESGSGVAQVLAILYIVLAARDPQVIAIDEPSSFLHPDAARGVMRILANYPQHQYIISTHSPEIISSSTNPTITILTHAEGQTHFDQRRGNEVEHIRAALIATGARLSDLFGYDRVLWVEGPSDAQVYEWLIRQLNESSLDRTVVRPVIATGDFETASIDRTVDIYRGLSHAKALVPVTLGFLFDRETRSDKDIEDAERRLDAKVRFLHARMLENYFLDSTVISATLASLEPRLEKSPSPGEIAAWIKENAPEVERDQAWRLTVHGKELRQKLFLHFSDAKHEYREVIHLPLLARQQLKYNQLPLRELAEKLAEMHAVPAEAIKSLGASGQ